MHEFSLAQGVLQIVRTAAQQNGLHRVVEVRLDIGRLAGVSLDALQFAWRFIRAQDSLTTDAELAINEPGGIGECSGCGYVGEVKDCIRICPRCGTGGLRFKQGEEFMVTGISGE